MNAQNGMSVGCHMVHVVMVSEFLCPKCLPYLSCFLGHGKLLLLLLGIIEHAHQFSMFYPGVDNCFGADGDFCVSSKGLTLPV